MTFSRKPQILSMECSLWWLCQSVNFSIQSVAHSKSSNCGDMAISLPYSSTSQHKQQKNVKQCHISECNSFAGGVARCFPCNTNAQKLFGAVWLWLFFSWLQRRPNATACDNFLRFSIRIFVYVSRRSSSSIASHVHLSIYHCTRGLVPNRPAYGQE